MNAIHVIRPRWEGPVLVFDDPAVGLTREPFVAGADEALRALSGGAESFTVLFSESPFPGCQAHLEWRREEHGGDWYWCEQVGHEGWLCPALRKYFPEPPKDIYLEVRT